MKNKDTSFDFKKLSIEDIENYLVLNDDYFFIKLSDRVDIHEYSKKLHENALHFTLYEGDKLVGFSPCYFDQKNSGISYISALIIRHDYQGFGLAHELLDHIKEYAEENDFHKIIVSFHCENNKSIGFYEKNAFRLFDQNKKTGICAFEYDRNN